MDRTKDEVRLLFTTQCRLRHLKGLSARNVVDASTCNVVAAHTGRLGLYFTMHSGPHSPAFYTSEVLCDTTNPNWTNFNWATHCERINTALPSVVLKLWRQSTATLSDRKPISEQNVIFKELHYLGEQIPKDGVRFQPNTLAFEMSEGIYTCTDAVWKAGGRSASRRNERVDVRVELAVHKSLLRKSYALSTLKRVRTVQRALKQTRAAVQAIRDRVHCTLTPSLQKSEMAAERKLLHVRLDQLRDELHYHRQRLYETREQCSDLKEKNRLKGLDISASVRLLRKSKDDLLEFRRNLIDARENLVKTSAQLVLRRRQLISELGFIYPIEEIQNKGYTICGVHLPNSEDFAGHDEIMVSVGLGYVCHMVVMISQFLQVPPRYLIQHGGSRSKINDNFLSTIPDSDREFPLYTRGTDKLHFQYGVYLLNKNVAQFRYYCGYTTYDLRCTLANLKTLLELRPVSKTEPTTPVSISGAEQSSSMTATPRNKDSRQSNEVDASTCGSTASLDLDGSVSHRRPLWRPSPECCRPATLSVSLDHGLDELSDGGPTTATTTPMSALTPLTSSAELRMSEPSLTAQHLLQDKTDVFSCTTTTAAAPTTAAAGAVITANGTVGMPQTPSSESFGQQLYGSENEIEDDQSDTCSAGSY